MEGAVRVDFYRSSTEEVFREVDSQEKGLTTAAAKERIEKYGYNELKEQNKASIWKLFLENFKDPMVIVLLIAAGVQIVLGEIMESVIIFIVLIVNAIISSANQKS